MKGLKGVWIGLMIVLFFAGMISGQRELYLLFFIMGIILLYSFFLNLYTIFSFSYIQKLEKENSVKGEGNTLHVEIHNEKPFPLSFIRADVQKLEASESEQFQFSLPPNSFIDFDVSIPSPYRGVFDVGISELEVNDSFGLVKTKFHMSRLPYYRPTRLKIYPRLLEFPFLVGKRRDVKRLGNPGQKQAEQGESYSDLRSYRPGDSLKRIHRAISARKHELFVKTYDMPVETSVQILLHMLLPESSGEESLYLADLACECVTAIAYHSMMKGYQVIFSCSAHAENQVFSSPQGFYRLYDILAELDFSRQRQKNQFIRIYESTLYDVSIHKDEKFSGVIIRFQGEEEALRLPLGVDVAAILGEGLKYL